MSLLFDPPRQIAAALGDLEWARALTGAQVVLTDAQAKDLMFYAAQVPHTPQPHNVFVRYVELLEEACQRYREVHDVADPALPTPVYDPSKLSVEWNCPQARMWVMRGAQGWSFGHDDAPYAFPRPFALGGQLALNWLCGKQSSGPIAQYTLVQAFVLLRDIGLRDEQIQYLAWTAGTELDLPLLWRDVASMAATDHDGRYRRVLAGRSSPPPGERRWP